MTIFNFGSINIDRFYTVPSLPKAGETLSATSFGEGLGGKGANQSIAAAQGGAKVMHIGAVGPDGDAVQTQLRDNGVNLDHVACLDIPTGHAIINVDTAGENAIVIFSSANVALTKSQIDAALSGSKKGDTCLLQNETNLVAYIAETARKFGLNVVYSAAPFDLERVKEVLPFVDLLVMNEGEAQNLSDALGLPVEKLPVATVLITLGSAGAIYRSGDTEIQVPAFNVDPVDTTGAGDTYIGFFLAGLDSGLDPRGAMKFASAAAAIQVTRKGTADAIPTLTEVRDFLEIKLAG